MVHVWLAYLFLNVKYQIPHLYETTNKIIVDRMTVNICNFLFLSENYWYGDGKCENAKETVSR